MAKGQLDYVLRDCTIFVDKISQAGNSESIELPVVEEDSKSHRGGGMDFEIEFGMGWKPLRASFVSVSLDPEIMQAAAKKYGDLIPYTAYGYLLGETGKETNVVARLKARAGKEAFDKWKAGDLVTLTTDLVVQRYELTIANRPIYKIDTHGRIFERNGVDVTRRKRVLLGGS